MAAAALAVLRKHRKRQEQDEDVNGAGDGVIVDLGSSSVAPPKVAVPKDVPHAPSTLAAGSPAADEVDTKHPEILPGQLKVYDFYQKASVQWFVAAIITANFFVTILEKELDPYPPDRQANPGTWRNLDVMFNTMFIFELIVNMYGSWLVPFWKQGWNVFDFIVVLASVLTMTDSLPPSMKQIKMLRAFRVFRLFKRIEALNKIVTALFKAIPGVFNAFLIMIIVRFPRTRPQTQGGARRSRLRRHAQWSYPQLGPCRGITSSIACRVLLPLPPCTVAPPRRPSPPLECPAAARTSRRC